MEKGVVLESERLSRIVDGKALVNDVSVQIAVGEILAVTGPSGSGKSSFLRLLNRLDEPTGGTVLLQGTDYREIPPRELRRKVGMVTQRAFLFPGTVADNLRFGPRQYGASASDDQVDALLAKVGLPGYAGRDVTNLSGGEAQRVSVARAVANSPIVLLLDEPTSALDDAAKAGIESLIRSLIRQDGLTCVLVTHDVAQASRVADRIMVIESGRVVKIGDPAEVLHAQSDSA
ncbi:MAG TPA: phosphate ABC transporter ATP-binding protein [Candidatus Solibacter sp.]|jgi:putative ABC transport system ATP-binding protein|nr:phosphate ABC transporter ATP-binding protein [Candidatus Solibacter sp.]